MDNILKQAMLQQCIIVKSEWDTLGSEEDEHGLCSHIQACGGDPDDRLDIQRALLQCFRMWPEYSGDPLYPVPSPDGYEDDEYAFGGGPAKWAYDQLDLWTGPYGEARMRLLDFIIQTISEELHNAV